MYESGFFNIFKPPGMTSHDVVAYVKRRTGAGKLGHGGTLDPVACGVLVCLVNGATKLASAVAALEKTYVAEAVFGLKTDTGDFDGRLTERRESDITKERLEQVLGRFTGEIEQVPPMVSALKKDGRPLYKLARQGVEVERAPRRVVVSSLKLLGLTEERGYPRARLEIKCSGGTYVRTLVEDIGAALDAPAATGFLARTAVGPFSIADSVAPGAIDASHAARFLVPPDFIAPA